MLSVCLYVCRKSEFIKMAKHGITQELPNGLDFSFLMPKILGGQLQKERHL